MNINVTHQIFNNAKKNLYRNILPKKLSLLIIKNISQNNFNKSYKSIKNISNIEPQYLAGTKCNGSIPLKNFWDFFLKTSDIKKIGYSTNKDGFGNSYLKAKSYEPISTSYVHDCSVMYLYNKDTKTHALYHALPDCTENYLSFMIRTLMPEGFTKGAIIPGDSDYYMEHYSNMKNMFNLMHKFSPKAKINVYHSTIKYPEIVGKDGMVFQIPNKKVQKQIKSGDAHICDFGQASFKILDLQGTSTFEQIDYCCRNINDLILLRNILKKEKYPLEIKEILYDFIEKKINNLTTNSKPVWNDILLSKRGFLRKLNNFINNMWNTANIFFRGF